MGTRKLHQILFDNPDGLMSGFGGAKRDRTADLLHAMQALSQLSYGPDVPYRARHSTGLFAVREAISASCRCLGKAAIPTKKTRCSGSSISMNGVPTGIRTPVATVKG